MRIEEGKQEANYGSDPITIHSSSLKITLKMDRAYIWSVCMTHLTWLFSALHEYDGIVDLSIIDLHDRSVEATK